MSLEKRQQEFRQEEEINPEMEEAADLFAVALGKMPEAQRKEAINNVIKAEGEEETIKAIKEELKKVEDERA